MSILGKSVDDAAAQARETLADADLDVKNLNAAISKLNWLLDCAILVVRDAAKRYQVTLPPSP